MRMLIAIALALGLFGMVASADAASCTPGTDCYCDKVRGGVLNDTALLFCEDFEAPTLRLDQGVGNGAPYYGPWYDATGDSGNRGLNSYWNRLYGNGDSGLWANGQPGSPTVGSNCTYALCVGALTWDSSNRWDANSFNPLMAIFDAAADFTAEDATLTAPSNTANGGSNGCFDGNACLAYRMPAGNNNGIKGEATFSAVTEIGMTMAMAYPVNSLSSGIWGTVGTPASWKHNEWSTVENTSSGFDGAFVFYNQTGPRSGIPFAGFFGDFSSPFQYAGSITKEAGLNGGVGNADLIGDGLGIYWNTPGDGYVQATDWPEGTWGCIRGHWKIVGSEQQYKVWFQGPNDTEERLIFDLAWTTSTLDNASGYAGMKWNPYANTNQGGGYVESTELTFRYEDNLHVRQGVPVSCAQIGFEGGAAQEQPETTHSMDTTWVVRTTAISIFFALLLWGIYVAGFGTSARNGTRMVGRP
jgi:hypothetical protein